MELFCGFNSLLLLPLITSQSWRQHKIWMQDWEDLSWIWPENLYPENQSFIVLEGAYKFQERKNQSIDLPNYDACEPLRWPAWQDVLKDTIVAFIVVIKTVLLPNLTTTQQKDNHVCYWKPIYTTTWAREFMDYRGKTATPTLVNQYNFYLYSKLYTHR